MGTRKRKHICATTHLAFFLFFFDCLIIQRRKEIEAAPATVCGVTYLLNEGAIISDLDQNLSLSITNHTTFHIKNGPLPVKYFGFGRKLSRPTTLLPVRRLTLTLGWLRFLC